VRRFAPFLLGYLIAGVVLTAVMLLLPEVNPKGYENPLEPIVFILKSTLLILAPALAGVMIFSGGLEDRSAEFTASLPVSSTRVWMGKLAAGAVLTGFMVGALLSADIICLVGGISRAWFEWVSLYVELDILRLAAWAGLFLHLLLSSSLSAQLVRRALPAFFLCMAFGFGPALIVELNQTYAVSSLFGMQPNLWATHSADPALTWLLAFGALPWLAFLSWHLFQRTRGHGNDLYARTAHGLIGLAGTVLSCFFFFLVMTYMGSKDNGMVGGFCFIVLLVTFAGSLLGAWGVLRRWKAGLRLGARVVVGAVLGTLGFLLVLDYVGRGRFEEMKEHLRTDKAAFADQRVERVVFRPASLDEDAWVHYGRALQTMQKEGARTNLWIDLQDFFRLYEWTKDSPKKMEDMVHRLRELFKHYDRAVRCRWCSPGVVESNSLCIHSLRDFVRIILIRARLALKCGRKEEALLGLLELMALGHDSLQLGGYRAFQGNHAIELGAKEVASFLVLNRGDSEIIEKLVNRLSGFRRRRINLVASVESSRLGYMRSLLWIYEDKTTWCPGWIWRGKSHLTAINATPCYMTTRFDKTSQWSELEDQYARYRDLAKRVMAVPEVDWEGVVTADDRKGSKQAWGSPLQYISMLLQRPDALDAVLLTTIALLHEVRTGRLPRTLEDLGAVVPEVREHIPPLTENIRYSIVKLDEGEDFPLVEWARYGYYSDGGKKRGPFFNLLDLPKPKSRNPVKSTRGD
jgi:ABC-type transport system involved in multi-copper enzyme maturation permease subunit